MKKMLLVTLIITLVFSSIIGLVPAYAQTGDCQDSCRI